MSIDGTPVSNLSDVMDAVISASTAVLRIGLRRLAVFELRFEQVMLRRPLAASGRSDDESFEPYELRLFNNAKLTYEQLAPPFAHGTIDLDEVESSVLLQAVTCGHMRSHAVACGRMRLHAVTTCTRMHSHAVTCCTPGDQVERIMLVRIGLAICVRVEAAGFDLDQGTPQPLHIEFSCHKLAALYECAAIRPARPCGPAPDACSLA